MGNKVSASTNSSLIFYPIERAKEKQASRDQDAKELAQGLISVKELNARNGAFKVVKCDILGAKR
jgi:hypothetical protein